MGAFLDKPKTEKTTQCGEGYGIKFGVSAMQGWRMEMEDAHVCTTEFKLKNWSFFGVFDGHAGSKVSLYCADNLLACILQCLEKNYGVKDDYSVTEIEHAMHDGFIQMDSQLLEHPTWKNGDDHSGTTAIVVMISPTHIIWANCGDSRGLFCRSNELNFATSDHKPVNVTEKTRIEKAGGTVMMQRVNGTLAVSRALGDFAYKRDGNLQPIEQLVSPEPDLTSIDRESDNDEFLVLACDGIYDVMSNNDVLTHVRHKLELTDDLEQICSDLIDTCLHKVSKYRVVHKYMCLFQVHVLISHTCYRLTSTCTYFTYLLVINMYTCLFYVLVTDQQVHVLISSTCAYFKYVLLINKYMYLFHVLVTD